MSERRESERSEARDLHLRTATEQSPLGTVIFDPDGRCLLVNAAWGELWDMGEDEVLDEGDDVFDSKEMRLMGLLPYLRETMNDGRRVTPILRYEPATSGPETGPGTGPRWLKAFIYPVRDQDGGLLEVGLMLEDFTERRVLEEQLAHQAFHDPLTGLPNRMLLTERLGHALARAWQKELRSGASGDVETIALLFIDLDNFKRVNDSLGHQAGDQLLVGVAERVGTQLRPGDTFARFGGDEFAVLLDDGEDESGAMGLAERIVGEMRAPFLVGGEEVFVTASIGVVLSDRGEVEGEELLRRADVAMYQSKRAGKDRCALFFHDTKNTDLRHLKLDGELRKAIEAGALRTLLDVKVLDPAMGSGHFLVAAVDYLTDEFSRIISELDAEPVVEELAELRAGIQASLEAYGASATDEQLKDSNLLKRMVLKRCVYGVDLNEMAVELAKLSLWLDAFTVGAPLSFLDHHLKHGNSLIGSSVREVRREVETSGSLLGNQFTATLIQGTELMQHVGEIPDATEGEVKESIDAYAQADKVLAPYKRMLDIWTSQHFGNSGAERFLSMTTSTGDVDHLTKGDYAHFTGRDRETIDTAIGLSEDKHFFHWELEFPEVFYEGARERENVGFDAVVGNPPYVSAPAMVRETPDLRSYLTSTVDLLTMKWDLYCAFLALEWGLLARKGRLGAIVPNQFLYQDYAAPLRLTFARDAEISQIVDLGNTVVFENVSVMTCILGLTKDIQIADSQVSAAVTQERYLSTLGTTIHYSIPQQLFLELPNNIYRLTLDRFAHTLVQKLLQGSYPLGKLCYGSVGVVPHSEKLNKPKEAFIFDRKINDKCKRYIEGKNADRYLIKWDGNWLEYDYNVVRRPSLPELLETNKIALKIVAGKTGLRAVYDTNAFYTDHSFVLFALKKQLEDVRSRSLHLEPEDIELSSRYDLLTILALINSKLLGWLFRSYLSSDLNIGPDDARRIPIRMIDFSTQPHERTALFEKSVSLYRNDHEALLSHVAAWMKTHPAQSDLVSDLLAYLAGEMTAMHGSWEEIIQTWRKWTEARVVNRPSLTKEFLEEVWIKVGLESGWEGVKAEFQSHNAIPSGKVLQDLKRETEEALEELRPLYERIQRTDELIDQIVYRLYGLTEDEISVVEASVGRG